MRIHDLAVHVKGGAAFIRLEFKSLPETFEFGSSTVNRGRAKKSPE